MVDKDIDEDVGKDKSIIQSAEALRRLFESIEVDSEDFKAHAARTPERSQDRWGLKSEIDSYKSSKSIDIIIDEFGNKRISVT